METGNQRKRGQEHCGHLAGIQEWPQHIDVINNSMNEAFHRYSLFIFLEH